MLRFNADVRRQLCAQGFASVPGKNLVVEPAPCKAVAAFLRDFRDIPLESRENCPAQNRGRRVQEFVLLPWQRQLVSRPPNEGESFTYKIAASLNPEHAGKVRRFPAFTLSQQQNEFLRELVLWQFQHLPLSPAETSQPVEVLMHLIAYRPRPGVTSVGTPNYPHQDGEPWVLIALVDKTNILGGETLIADDNKRELGRVMLTDPLDLLLFADEKVYHHVTEMTVAPLAQEGSRVVLIVNLTPMQKVASRR